MLNIAVSGINAVDNPGPGTGIIRALKESSLNIRSLGLAYDALEPGIFMADLVDKTYLMPYPSSDRESFIERLRYIHSIEAIDVIITTLDAELPVFIDLETELEQMGIRMLIPSKKMFGLRNKTKLKALAEALQIKSPQYIVCTSYEDLVAAVNQIGFPCMIKGPFYEAFKATGFGEAECHFNQIVKKWGYPIIVQQFVHGEEYDVIGCGDGSGDSLGLFAIKKMTITSLGKVWNAVSIANPQLMQTAQNLLEHLNWRGGFELEVLIEDKSRDIYLLEINPRFPAWVYMAAACGINLPERMVQYLLGLTHKRHSDYRSGKLMIRYTSEMIKDISDFEQITAFGELENHPRAA